MTVPESASGSSKPLSSCRGGGGGCVFEASARSFKTAHQRTGVTALARPSVIYLAKQILPLVYSVGGCS